MIKKSVSLDNYDSPRGKAGNDFEGGKGNGGNGRDLGRLAPERPGTVFCDRKESLEDMATDARPKESSVREPDRWWLAPA